MCWQKPNVLKCAVGFLFFALHTTTTHKGFEHFKTRLSAKIAVEFEMLNQFELFTEMKLFVETLMLEETIFRSDHASNILVLKVF